MAISWDELKDTSDTDPPIVTLHGGVKLGKTTLASEFPLPYYCRTADGERQSSGTPMKSFGVSDTYQDVVDQMDWMLEAEHDRRTFVLDALDGMETLINAEVCVRNGWADIEAPGFGAGYTAAHGLWLEFIKKILALKKAGYYVVLISHTKSKTVPGITSESYPRYLLNIRDTSAQAVSAASDLIGFMHKRVSIQKEDMGFKKKANRGEGGAEILIGVQWRPGYEAGSRYEIEKPVLPFKIGQGFALLNKYFPPQPGIDFDVPAPESEDEDEAA